MLRVRLTALLFLSASATGAPCQIPSDLGGGSHERDVPRLVIQLGHADRVNAVALSADGRLMATASDDQTVILRNIVANRSVRQITGHRGGVICAQFSPDAKTLLTGGTDDTVRLWDVDTGKELFTIPGVRWGRFAPEWYLPERFRLSDARLVLFDGKDQFTVRPLDKGANPSLTIRVAKPVAGYAVSYTATALCTRYQDNTTEAFSLSSGRITARGTFDGPLAYDKDGELIASTENHGTEIEVCSLKAHRTCTFTLPKSENNPQPRVTALAFLPGDFDERVSAVPPLAVGLDTGDVLLLFWKETQTAVARPLGRVPGSVTDVVAQTIRDGSLIAASSTAGTAHVWTSDAKEVAHRGVVTNELRPISVEHVPKELAMAISVHSVTFSPSEPLLAVACGRMIKTWDLRTGGLRWSLSEPGFYATHLTFSPDGSALLAADGMNLQLCLVDPATGQVSRVWRAGVASNRILPAPWAGFQTEMALAFRGEFSPDGKTISSVGGMTGNAPWDRITARPLAIDSSPSQAVPYCVGHGNAYFVTRRGALAVELSRAVGGSQYAGIPHLVAQTAGKPEPVTAEATRPGDSWPPPGIDPREYLFHPDRGHIGAATCALISPDGQVVFTGGRDNRVIMWNVPTRQPVRSFLGHSGAVRTIEFVPGTQLLVTGGHDGTVRVWQVETGRELGCLTVFADGTWAFSNPEGRYDASNGGDVEGLEWVVGNEPIALKQLKERYYEPGLLAKIMGSSREPLRKVEAFRDVKLFPELSIAEIMPADERLTLNLINRGGGIGRVQIFVNGKEFLADARGPKPDSLAKTATLTVDMSGAHLISGEPNRVEVVTWNAEGYLCSRGLVREFTGPVKATEPPQLYAVVAGVSQYDNPALNLRFAAKDAEDFATALTLGSQRLFGAKKVHLTRLITTDQLQTLKPTKDNFQKVFADLRQAEPGDVLVVYLAGHGVALQQGNDLYCYLTADARSLDPQTLNDPAVREATTVSSEELAEWIKKIPALKQVMILDTCAAGAAAVRLTEKRDVSGDQIRAIERLKDRTGFHVLMGCAADRVSYEASRYAQGLLTYSLLQGMRGAALREEQFVDVSRLFQYAADRVPELARNIGGVQRPVVAAPRGTSFDVGRLATEDRARVPLALVKPLVLKPALLNRDEDEDNLQLTALLRQRLTEASQPAGRGSEPAIVYVPEDDFPGAVRPTGTYTIQGDNVAIRLTLKRDGAVLARLQVEGNKGDLPALAQNMARAVLAAVE